MNKKNKVFPSPRIIQLIYFPLISTPLFMYEMPVPKNNVYKIATALF